MHKITISIAAIAIILLSGCNSREPDLSGEWLVDIEQLSQNLNSFVESGKLTAARAQNILNIRCNERLEVTDNRMIYSGSPSWDDKNITFTTRTQDEGNIIEINVDGRFTMPQQYVLNDDLLIIRDFLSQGLHLPYRRIN